MNKLDNFIKLNAVKTAPILKVGDEVAVHQRIKEEGKERIQIFDGLVIARKHGKEPGATFTVRKTSQGIGVERIFPLYSPLIEKVKVMRSFAVGRSKIYFMRTAKGKRAKLKEIRKKK